MKGKLSLNLKPQLEECRVSCEECYENYPEGFRCPEFKKKIVILSEKEFEKLRKSFFKKFKTGN
jgi:hypothetical protein